MLPKVYVISLPERSDRRAKLLPQLEEQGITPIWVEAIRGAEMGFRYPFCKDGRYNGLLGCHASHLALWKMAKEPIIIMEDDCVLKGDLQAAYDAIKHRTEPIHFFGWSTYASKKYKETDIAGVVIPEKPLTTHCYLYRPNKDLIREASYFDEPIDIVTSKSGGTANYPMIAVQAPGRSDITKTFVDYGRFMR